MNAQKEIKKMAKILDEAECVEDALFVDFDGMATALVNSGYGDVKQAVREFAERLKDTCTFDGHRLALDKNIIDELVKEVCGE